MAMESPVFDVWPAPRVSLPRGPHGLPRDVVERSQRSRLELALVDVVAEKGYVATTVADIIAAAGVSRTTFYQQFKDKEDCFLHAYRRGADAQFRKVVEAVESATDPLEQLRGNLRAYLGALVDYPACARAFLLELAAAGPRALAIKDEIEQRYVELFRRLHAGFRERNPGLPEPPVEVLRAAVAAVDDMVVRRIREGRLADLAELEPIATYVELSLFGLPSPSILRAPG
ncbi:MAG TPA: TetR/AcrR family transcriptional regulator [Actinomycetes bacterium]|nr:TetR/AcrR family transcriptional regulator [Actinomycetes bacterium]